MKRATVIVGGLIFTGFCAIFVACSADDSNGNGPDGSTGDSTTGADGSTDGANPTDGALADGAIVSDDGSIITDGGRRADGGPCTPRVGGPFNCGVPGCTDSTTQYCIYGAVPNTCEPLPPECQCQETFSCACLVANLICDDGGAEGVCVAYADAGFLLAADAGDPSYFWLQAHHCTVK